MLDWMQANETLLWWMAIASIAAIALTIIALPLFLISLPADHFLYRKRHGLPWAERHPLVRWLLRILGNLVGAVLLLAGIAMLVLPGQGLLTMLVGLMLMNFPGKYRVERWVVGKPAVRNGIDWLRSRAGRTPLMLDEATADDRQESASGSDTGDRQ